MPDKSQKERGEEKIKEQERIDSLIPGLLYYANFKKSIFAQPPHSKNNSVLKQLKPYEPFIILSKEQKHIPGDPIISLQIIQGDVLGWLMLWGPETIKNIKRWELNDEQR